MAGLVRDLLVTLEAQQARGAPTHNEVVVDLDFIHAELPHSVLAFFYMEDPAQARRFQAAFTAEYGLGDADCPVVRLDLSGADAFSLG